MQSASYQSAFYPESRFGGFTDIDGNVAFYARVNALVDPSFQIVDFGCGRGVNAEDPVVFRRNLRCFRRRVAKVIGLDVDPVALANPTVDECRLVMPGATWPVEDNTTDLLICDWVLEHLSNPEMFFSEARRILVPGGFLCIRTTNVMSYVGVAAKCIPAKKHAKVLGAVQLKRREEDVFPTAYRCNTVFKLRRQMARFGFRSAVYGYESEPHYLQLSRFAYSLGVFHQRLAPGFLRPALFAFGELVDCDLQRGLRSGPKLEALQK